VGSNSFAVAGSHTCDGDALLANDIHLTLTAPLAMHEVQLVGGGFDLHGFVIPGIFGVAIGRSPWLSWGITAGLVHDLDLYAERLHPRDSSRYLTPDGWHSFFERSEVFRIRGEEEEVRRVAESRHGPLLETVATEAPAGLRFAVAWTGQRPGRDIDALLGMWRARNLSDLDAALRHHVCPTYNLVVATADGRVGRILAGVIPRRRVGTPLRPLEGWTGAWDWKGVVPWEENPRLLDPESGIVVAANTEPAPAGYAHELGGLFEPPYRFERIHARLAALGHGVAWEDLAAVQLDELSVWGAAVRDLLLEVVGGVDGLARGGRERTAAELWRDWDGRASPSSPGAAVAMLVAHTAGVELVCRLAGDEAAFAWAELGALSSATLTDLPTVLPRLAVLGIDAADLVRHSFMVAVEECSNAMGPDVTAWRWGDIHPILCVHRFHGTPLGGLLDIGPEPAGGGPDTVNRGGVGVTGMRLTAGPAMRLVVSARNRDRAGTIMPGGQSGNRWSPHYDDQLVDFLAGRLKGAPVSRQCVRVILRERWLPPAGQLR
jgi:penicillin amidase